MTPGQEGMIGAVKKAEELLKSTPNSFMPQQFKNPANPEVHRKTTAREIWIDTDGKVDILVAGVGTGGTITGCGEVLKQKNGDLHVVAVEPAESPVLSGGEPGSHQIQGIGAGFVPEVLNRDIIDEVMTVSTQEALETAEKLGIYEGIHGGVSSGANLRAAMKLAQREENKGKTIVTFVCDTGERYISTALYDKLPDSQTAEQIENVFEEKPQNARE